MPKKNKDRKRGGPSNFRRTISVKEYCRFELPVPSQTSGTGLTVIDSYLMSTDMNARWQGLAYLYQRWRIRKMIFHYISQNSTNTNGRAMMAVIEDADGVAPTDFPSGMRQRCSVENAGRNTMKLVYVPKHEGWLWTRDLSLNEDRLEYPGYLVFGTASYAVTTYPGYIWVESWAEFDEPSTSETSISFPLTFPKEWSAGRFKPSEARRLRRVEPSVETETPESEQETKTLVDPAQPVVPVGQLVDLLKQMGIVVGPSQITSTVSSGSTKG